MTEYIKPRGLQPTMTYGVEGQSVLPTIINGALGIVNTVQQGRTQRAGIEADLEKHQDTMNYRNDALDETKRHNLASEGIQGAEAGVKVDSRKANENNRRILNIASTGTRLASVIGADDKVNITPGQEGDDTNAMYEFFSAMTGVPTKVLREDLTFVHEPGSNEFQANASGSLRTTFGGLKLSEGLRGFLLGPSENEPGNPIGLDDLGAFLGAQSEGLDMAGDRGTIDKFHAVMSDPAVNPAVRMSKALLVDRKNLKEISYLGEQIKKSTVDSYDRRDMAGSAELASELRRIDLAVASATQYLSESGSSKSPYAAQIAFNKATQVLQKSRNSQAIQDELLSRHSPESPMAQQAYVYTQEFRKADAPKRWGHKNTYTPEEITAINAGKQDLGHDIENIIAWEKNSLGVKQVLNDPETGADLVQALYDAYDRGHTNPASIRSFNGNTAASSAVSRYSMYLGPYFQRYQGVHAGLANSMVLPDVTKDIETSPTDAQSTQEVRDFLKK